MISVGIDVAKDKSMVCIMKPGGEVIAPPYEMLHTMESVLALAKRISAFDEETRVTLEDTGHYHWPIVCLLVDKGVFVSSINALRMKKYCSQSLRKVKTDRSDSIRIAEYGLTYWHELVQHLPKTDSYAELRSLSRQYYQYISLAIKAKINLSNLLDRVMPGVQEVLVNANGKHKLTDFVQKYWHFENITAKSEKVFLAGYCKWAQKEGYRKNESTAQKLYALSQNGIPSLPNTATTKLLMLEAVRCLHELEISRDTILTHMQTLANTLPEYEAVRAMSGVGPKLTPRLIAEIGDISRFHSKNALIAYAGIDAPPYQSGSFTATNRSISKRGNKYLRKSGYEVMQALLRKPPSVDTAVYDFICKKRNEGKGGKVAMIAGLNKFLRIYYARVSEAYNIIEEQIIFGSQI